MRLSVCLCVSVFGHETGIAKPTNRPPRPPAPPCRTLLSHLPLRLPPLRAGWGRSCPSLHWLTPWGPSTQRATLPQHHRNKHSCCHRNTVLENTISPTEKTALHISVLRNFTPCFRNLGFMMQSSFSLRSPLKFYCLPFPSLPSSLLSKVNSRLHVQENTFNI